MTLQQTTHTRSRRGGRSAVLGALAAITLAACGGSSGSTSDTATAPAGPDTTAPDTTAPDTTSPDTTSPDTTSTTVAPTTSSTPAALSVAVGPDWTEWLTVRRVVRDGGYWGVPEGGLLPVEARTYWMRCDTEPCTTPTFESRAMDETESNGDELTAAIEGTVLTFGNRGPIECTDPATGQPTGPATAEVANGWTLDAVGDTGAVWSGSYEYRLTSEASADCAAEDIGYLASMVLFDPAAVALTDDVEGIWLGESNETIGVENGIRPCTAEEECDVMLRTSRDDVGGSAAGGPGVTRSFHDIPLERQADGTFYGTDQYASSCNSDTDGSYVSASGYLLTHQVWLSVYDLGEGAAERFVAEFDSAMSGETHPDLTPEQAAQCAPFEKPAGRLLALPNDGTPAVVDWDVPEAQPFPIPTAG